VRRQLSPVATVLLMVLAGCGVSPAWDGDPSTCSYVEYGACFVLDGGELSRDDSRHAIAIGVAVFGGSPDDIRGYLVRVEPIDFRGACGHPGSIGCQDDYRMSIEIGGACPAAVLAHEFGHIVIGDAGHENPLWRDERLAAKCVEEPPSGGTTPAPGR